MYIICIGVLVLIFLRNNIITLRGDDRHLADLTHNMFNRASNPREESVGYLASDLVHLRPTGVDIT